MTLYTVDHCWVLSTFVLSTTVNFQSLWYINTSGLLVCYHQTNANAPRRPHDQYLIPLPGIPQGSANSKVGWGVQINQYRGGWS